MLNHNAADISREDGYGRGELFWLTNVSGLIHHGT